MTKRKVILGVTQSDSHVVGNRLIEMSLTQQGYKVINLGVCTSILEFINAYLKHQEALCIAIGNLNGHVITDTRELNFLRKKYKVHCPIIIGGSPHSKLFTSKATRAALKNNGFDHVMTSVNELQDFLDNCRPCLDRMSNKSYG